jgi:hypothetical protein
MFTNSDRAGSCVASVVHGHPVKITVLRARRGLSEVTIGVKSLNSTLCKTGLDLFRSLSRLTVPAAKEDKNKSRWDGHL